MELTKDLESDYSTLLEVSIEVLQRLADVPIGEDHRLMIYAEGIGHKILEHVISAKQISGGYQLIWRQSYSDQRIDFASIAVLTRAAFEAYLTFNFLFVSPSSKDESLFRCKCWDLAGYIERSKFPAKKEEHIKLQEAEAIEIEKLQKEIGSLPLFSHTLSPKQQTKVLQGEWRMFKDWKDLAIAAGFTEKYFKAEYSYLCGYAHSGRLSVLQIKSSKQFTKQLEYAQGFVVVLITLLAKFCYDYVQVMPTLKEVESEIRNYELVLYWKSVAESLGGQVPL